MDVLYLVSFLVIVGFVAGSAVWAVERIPGSRRTGWVAGHPRSVAIAWLVATAAPTLSGLLAPRGPVPPQALMAFVSVAAIGFSLSAVGGAIAATTPLHLLIGFQGFRLPLEIVLHRWVDAGMAPPQMTWSGSNLDIAAGTLALVSIPLVARWPRFAWVPTAIGFVLLANIFRIVARSLPGPLQTFPDPITLPSHFPHVWIATVCVTGALAGHIVAVRALLKPPSHADA